MQRSERSYFSYRDFLDYNNLYVLRVEKQFIKMNKILWFLRLLTVNIHKWHDQSAKCVSAVVIWTTMERVKQLQRGEYVNLSNLKVRDLDTSKYDSQ